jgi:hypothetical protein
MYKIISKNQSVSVRSAMQLAAGACAAKNLRELCSSCLKTPNFHSRLGVAVVERRDEVRRVLARWFI